MHGSLQVPQAPQGIAPQRPSRLPQKVPIPPTQQAPLQSSSSADNASVTKASSCASNPEQNAAMAVSGLMHIEAHPSMQLAQSIGKPRQNAQALNRKVTTIATKVLAPPMHASNPGVQHSAFRATGFRQPKQAPMHVGMGWNGPNGPHGQQQQHSMHPVQHRLGISPMHAE